MFNLYNDSYQNTFELASYLWEMNYSQTSNKGHSKEDKGQTKSSLPYKITPERAQPLYKGQKAGSRACPLFGGFTVIIIASAIADWDISYSHNFTY